LQVICSNCHQSYDFSGPKPAFCGLCGQPLTQSGAAPLADTDGSISGQVHQAATLVGDFVLSPSAEPKTIGEYNLVRRLGGGGMGDVWEAEHAETGRRVAIKLLSERLPRSSETVARFLREGRTAAAVSHPRSTFVFAAGESDGQPYIVMELMPGRTLADVVREKGPLPLARAVDYVLDISEGLQAAHALGLIHRDVKPSNCFLDGDGRVKVGDFGLSKSLVAERDLTRSGTFLGTPEYAAPEQVRGAELDQRADVYSVGATLFCLLTGRAPFVGDAAAVIAQIASEPPPPLRSLRPDAPKAVERIVARTLAKQPAKRFANLADLHAALAPHASGATSLADVGRRLAAYLFDMLAIQLGLGLATFAFAMLMVIWRDSWGELNSSESYFAVAKAAGPVLYFALAEGYFGRGLGKWLFGLQVARTTGDRAGLPRALVRAAFVPGALGLIAVAPLYPLWSPPSVGSVAPTQTIELLSQQVKKYVFDAPAMVGVLLCLTTMRKRNGYRGIHEFASGTRVVRSRLGVPRRRQGVPVVTPMSAGADTAFGPFRVIGELGRSAASTVLTASDDLLSRNVWVFAQPSADTSPSSQRIAVRRPTRPRWLQGGSAPQGRWDAFEAVTGAPLWAVARNRGGLNWDQARHWLLDLAEELAAAASDDTLPACLSLEQVWVDRSGRVKLLDAPLDFPQNIGNPFREEASTPFRGYEGGPFERALALLRTATQACTNERLLPARVGEFKAELTKRPATSESLAWAAAHLREAAGHTTALEWDQRLGILGASLSFELPLYLFVVSFLTVLLSAWLGGQGVRLLVDILLALALPAFAAFVMLGGPVFRMTGIDVLRTDGNRASRPRCAWRSALAWTPVLVPLVGSSVPALTGDTQSGIRQIIVGLTILFMGPLAVAGAIYAVASPRRGLQDQLAGTFLVPK
jgi:uncharacterized RDD family membrane protein YckC